MGTTDANTPMVQVPQDDGSIAQAITRLDELISTWAGEVDKVQGTLRSVVADRTTGDPGQQGVAPSSSATAAAQKADDEKKPPEPQPTSAEKSPQHPQVPKFTAEDAARMTRQATKTAAQKQQADTQPGRPEDSGNTVSRFRRLFGGKDEPQTGSTRSPSAAENDSAMASAAASAAGAELDDDEALLASLDPKVAKAIRIKRRLCNGRKSVRELLDEG